MNIETNATKKSRKPSSVCLDQEYIAMHQYTLCFFFNPPLNKNCTTRKKALCFLRVFIAVLMELCLSGFFLRVHIFALAHISSPLPLGSQDLLQCLSAGVHRGVDDSSRWSRPVLLVHNSKHHSICVYNKPCTNIWTCSFTLSSLPSIDQLPCTISSLFQDTLVFLIANPSSLFLRVTQER